MNSFLSRIEEELKTSLFTDNDLKLIFRDKEPSSLYNNLTYHLKNHHLERYRRGLYSLSFKNSGKLPFSKYQLANKLVLHSYISFESALSHHNLIPEGVYEVTSATLGKNVIFENSLGRFSFTYSPIDPFYLGVEKDEVSGARVANPIKALFDLVYARRKLYKTSHDLDDDLRIDLVELKTQLSDFKTQDIFDLGERYKKKTTRQLAIILTRDLM